MGAITAEERAAVRGRSPVGAKYDTPVNRESAYEMLTKRTASKAAARPWRTIATRRPSQDRRRAETRAATEAGRRCKPESAAP